MLIPAQPSHFDRVRSFQFMSSSFRQVETHVSPVLRSIILDVSRHSCSPYRLVVCLLRRPVLRAAFLLCPLAFGPPPRSCLPRRWLFRPLRWGASPSAPPFSARGPTPPWPQRPQRPSHPANKCRGLYNDLLRRLNDPSNDPGLPGLDPNYRFKFCTSVL